MVEERTTAQSLFRQEHDAIAAVATFLADESLERLTVQGLREAVDVAPDGGGEFPERRSSAERAKGVDDSVSVLFRNCHSCPGLQNQCSNGDAFCRGKGI